MRRFACIALFLPLAAAPAADKFDPAAAARAVAPFVDQQTVAVVRADARSAEVEAVIKLARRLNVLPETQAAEATRNATEIVGAFTRAGGRELYVVVSLDDVPTRGPFVVVPLAAGADEAALGKLLTQLPLGQAVKYGAALVVAPPATHERLKVARPSPRPEFAAALAAAADSSAQAVIVPSNDHRRVLTELMPKPPAAFDPDAVKTAVPRPDVGGPGRGRVAEVRGQAHGEVRRRRRRPRPRRVGDEGAGPAGQDEGGPGTAGAG